MNELTEGKCYYCEKIFEKKTMKKHLDSCDARKGLTIKIEDKNTKGENYFCILVEGFYLLEYWLYLEVPSLTTLKTLDKFLRYIWVECCEHLSAFEIEKTTYVSNSSGFSEDKSMNVPLKDVLNVGMKFTYDYDFGTTTRLKLKIISEYKTVKKDRKVELMARNLPPKIKCSYCDGMAKQVCVDCLFKGEGWLCDRCAEKHECDEDMFLPVVNSPRVGECGYTGRKEDRY